MQQYRNAIVNEDNVYPNVKQSVEENPGKVKIRSLKLELDQTISEFFFIVSYCFELDFVN